LAPICGGGCQSAGAIRWAPAVNNHGSLGRWAFVEISDPWAAEGTIRAAARGGGRGSVAECSRGAIMPPEGTVA